MGEKTMIKKFIIMIGITFVLTAVALCGCNEQSSNTVSTTNFIGTWKSTDYINQTWTFYENNTLKTEHIFEGNLTSDILNWEYNDGELCTMPLSNPNSQRCGNVKFIDSTTFTWTTAEQIIMTFNKV
jgi:hypothetical protein